MPVLTSGEGLRSGLVSVYQKTMQAMNQNTTSINKASI